MGLRDPALRTQQGQEGTGAPLILCLAVCPWASLLTTLSLSFSTSVPSKLVGLQSRRKCLGAVVPGCLSLNPSSVTGHLTVCISFPSCKMGITVVCTPGLAVGFVVGKVCLDCAREEGFAQYRGLLWFLFSFTGGRGDRDALTSRLCSTLSRSLSPDRSLRSLKRATSTVGRMAQERVRRTRAKRGHLSFRKPWSTGWTP